MSTASQPSLGEAGIKPEAVGRPQKQRKGGVLGLLTKFMPTNYNMLIFRTMNHDMSQPNASDDDIARRFRNSLMPVSFICGELMGLQYVSEHPKHGAPGTANYIDARTRWFDAALRSASKQGISQIVVIAAGFDSRAYRFHAPGLQFFELDLPHASAVKQQLVQKVLPDAQKHPRPVYIGVDLSQCSLQQALEGTGFQPAAPSLFICEGLIYYLPQGAVDKLFTDVANLAAPGSSFLLDFLHLDALQGLTHPVGYANTAEVVDIKGEPFLSGLDPSLPSISKKFAPLHMSVTSLLNSRDIVQQMLPHLAKDADKTHVLPFYSFAAVQRD